MGPEGSEPDSDYDCDMEGTKPHLPALPTKAALRKRKAGGAGKKVKIFADTKTMLELVDQVNAVQEAKVKTLIERDVREWSFWSCWLRLGADRAGKEAGAAGGLQEGAARCQEAQACTRTRPGAPLTPAG